MSETVITSHGDSTAHANPPRTLKIKPGRFGRLFPEIAVSPWTTGNASKDGEVSVALAEAMHAAESSDSDIPAGYTYLGQFIDHDITFDPTTLGDQVEDIDDLRNFRTPALDLDCLYGRGPRDQPYLYQRGSEGRPGTPPRLFLIGKTEAPKGGAGVNDDEVKRLANQPYDLPRISATPEGTTAILGDKRNDENLIVAQFHRTMLHFHNAVAVAHPALDFDQIRTTVIHHYQEMVLHDFLPRIAGREAVAAALEHPRFFVPNKGDDAFIPLEFSGAAYRFGHSLVRDTYHFNSLFPDDGFQFAFIFTANGGFFGGTAYPSNWLLDWRRFFQIDDQVTPVMASRIDPQLSGKLRIGQGNAPFLAELNLKRGHHQLKLPSGQAVARQMGLPVLTRDELTTGIAGDAVAALGIAESTPLWFYLLKEAEVKSSGSHLGPVGGAIVAEVFAGLLRADSESILSAPGATPVRLPRKGEKFQVADLFHFVEAQAGKKVNVNGKAVTVIPEDGVINPLRNAKPAA